MKWGADTFPSLITKRRNAIRIASNPPTATQSRSPNKIMPLCYCFRHINLRRHVFVTWGVFSRHRSQSQTDSVKNRVNAATESHDNCKWRRSNQIPSQTQIRTSVSHTAKRYGKSRWNTVALFKSGFCSFRHIVQVFWRCRDSKHSLELVFLCKVSNFCAYLNYSWWHLQPYEVPVYMAEFSPD